MFIRISDDTLQEVIDVLDSYCVVLNADIFHSQGSRENERFRNQRCKVVGLKIFLTESMARQKAEEIETPRLSTPR
jgi:hypothetical protein